MRHSHSQVFMLNPDFSHQPVSINYTKHVEQPVTMGTYCKKININEKEGTGACSGYTEPTVCL